MVHGISAYADVVVIRGLFMAYKAGIYNAGALESFQDWLLGHLWYGRKSGMKYGAIRRILRL